MGIRENVFGWIRNRPLLGATVGGLLLGCAFPPFNQYYFVLLAFVPLWMAVRESRGWGTVRCTATFGFVFYLIHTYWFTSFHLLALPGVLLVISFYFGVWGLFLDKVGSNPWMVAGSWALLQTAIGSGFLAFPWSRLATALAVEPLLVQPVRYFGEVTFGGLIVLLSLSIASALYRFRRFAFIVSILAILGGYLVGFNYYLNADLERFDQRVTLVQPNVISSFGGSDRSANQREVLHRLTLRHRRENDLVVWPESVLSDYGFDINHDNQRLKAKSPARIQDFLGLLGDGSRLLAGIRLYDPRENKLPLMNGAVLIDSSSSSSPFYTKRIMVPFGEYIPGMGRYDLIHWLGRALGTLGYRSGRFNDLIDLSGNEEEFSAAVQICYEDSFPAYVHDQVKREADLLVNMSNDSWSLSSAAHWQHFYRAKLRAIETGRAMLRNGNTGVSAIISPIGTVEEQLGPFERGVVQGRIFKAQEKSFIVNYSNTLTFGVIIVFLGVGFLRKRDRTHFIDSGTNSLGDQDETQQG